MRVVSVQLFMLKLQCFENGFSSLHEILLPQSSANTEHKLILRLITIYINKNIQTDRSEILNHIFQKMILK